MKIRLIGDHPKDRKDEWRDSFKKVLDTKFETDFIDDFWDYGVGESVVAHDSLLIKECDFVVANCNADVGPGTSMEFMISKYYNKFVVCVLSKGTRLRVIDRPVGDEIVHDWIHPFILAFSDLIVESVEDIPTDLDISEPKSIDSIERLVTIADKYRDITGIDTSQSSEFSK